MFKTESYKIRGHYFENNISNLKRVECITGGSTAINFFIENSFKNIYLIGFGGTGSTQLICDIPRTQPHDVWNGSTIIRQNFKNIYHYDKEDPINCDRNCDRNYENIYNEIKNKYPDLNLYIR